MEDEGFCGKIRIKNLDKRLFYFFISKFIIRH